ncbi:tbc domain protein [Diplodia corticola]|uniref:Tbc domain protein n=1 Tax=Diplodia corticola TaxID=236234 RepID=A0A1J9RVV6_9PEZI|nr:tbc domain protein [Diplodia corticola]OJD31972.1 tbc domain protein [Diplodia corticola]
MSAHDQLQQPAPPPENRDDEHPSPEANRRDSDAGVDLKAAQIRSACRDADLDTLTRLATTARGLLTDRLRRDAWPLLLGARDSLPDSDGDCDCASPSDSPSDSPAAPPWTRLPPHHDEDQVKLDVNRSFVYYPKDQSEQQIEERKEELFDVIAHILRRHPRLCYFQGYHDIVQVFLLVLGSDRAVPAVTRLSLLRIRDFMLPSLDAALDHLKLLPSILYSVDSALYEHLRPAEPFFALAATITMYAHDIQEYGDIARLFDFLLAHEAVYSVYLFAAIILTRKDELLEIPPDDIDVLHVTLQKLPKPLDLEGLIASTVELFAKKPPESLPWGAWRAISPYSVLRTTREPRALTTQTLEEAEQLLVKHEEQIRRANMYKKVANGIRWGLWRYRRPAGGFVMAVAVGVLAWWLGRSDHGATYLSTVRQTLYLFLGGQYR